MKTPFHILLAVILYAVGLRPLVAQQPVPPAAPLPGATQNIQNQIHGQVQASPNATPQRAPLIPLLSRNYTLRITVTEGEMVTEYRLVSAASQISISTPGGADAARSASINGQIEESEEGHIGIALVVSLAVPEPAPVQPGGVSPQPGGPGVPFQQGRGQRQSESFSASLRAKLGVGYPIFTTAARTYRLTITPHEGSTR